MDPAKIYEFKSIVDNDRIFKLVQIVYFISITIIYTWISSSHLEKSNLRVYCIFRVEKMGVILYLA